MNLENLNELDHNKLHQALSRIITNYTSPSLGSMSKHDIDLLIYETIVTLDIIKEDATIYDVMRDLKVTRSKARNLIYEYKLRKTENEDVLKTELRELLKTPLLSNQSDNVQLEVDNPYLIDFIRNELKKLGHITDGSFHAELVKMSADAFSTLYESTLTNENKVAIKRKLVKLGVKEDTSIKAILPSMIKGVAKTVAKGAFGKVGENIVDSGFKFLRKLIQEGFEVSRDNDIWKLINHNELDVPPMA